MTLKRLFIILILLLDAVLARDALAETGSEAAVKSAFLYHFFKFIDWPEAALQNNAMTLCTTNADHLGDSLLVLKTKTISNRPILINRGIPIKELKNCQMVYISGSDDTAAIIKTTQGLPIVTISDKPGFIDKGGMIGLLQGDNRLSFEINLDAANAVSLHIGAQLLKLAKRVNSEK